jgi:WD40 repeat protein
VLSPPSDDGTLLLTQTQPVITSFATLQISFNPQGNRLLTGSSDKTARIWDVQTGQCLQVLEGHTDEIFSCAFNYKGNIVITGMGGIHIKHLPGFPLKVASRILEGC